MPILTIAKQNTLTLISQPHPTIILGLSGGPDSVFMFHVLATLQNEGHISLIAAHLDHEWRTTSAADAQFCTDLCQSTNVILINKKASELNLNIKFNGSKEDIGRRLRRHFFESVKQQHNADFITLAHHRQDQQETFFLRLLRGTTLNGLTCMKTQDGHYIRPLLEIDKEAIITYLAEHNLPFCTDPTNESDIYLRNRIRKYVIPALKTIDPRFEQKLESTTKHLQKEDAYLQKIAQAFFDKIFTTQNNLLIGNLPEFKKLDPVMQRRVLLRWLIAQRVPFSTSEAFLNELCRFLNQDSGGTHIISSWTIAKKGTSFWIKPL